MKEVRSYILTEPVGSGTFATVYAAWHRSQLTPDGTPVKTENSGVSQIQFAVKVIDRSAVRTPWALRSLQREVAVLRSPVTRHPNLLHAKNVFFSRRRVYVVMPYASGGALLDYVCSASDRVSKSAEGSRGASHPRLPGSCGGDNCLAVTGGSNAADSRRLAQYKSKRKACPLGGGGLSEVEAAGLFCQVLQAVAQLHSAGVAHRDIKPDNILLKEVALRSVPRADEPPFRPVVAILSDFGLVGPAGRCHGPDRRTLQRSSTRGSLHTEARSSEGTALRPGTGSFVLVRTCCGTPMYTAPEVVSARSAGYDAAVADAWSLGVVLHSMVTGTLPFGNTPSPHFDEVAHAGRAGYTPPTCCSAPLQDLLSRLIHPDVSKRMSAANALRHPWVVDRVAIWARTAAGEAVTAHLEEEEREVRAGDVRRTYDGGRALIRLQSMVNDMDGALALEAEEFSSEDDPDHGAPVPPLIPSSSVARVSSMDITAMHRRSAADALPVGPDGRRTWLDIPSRCTAEYIQQCAADHRDPTASPIPPGTFVDRVGCVDRAPPSRGAEESLHLPRGSGTRATIPLGTSSVDASDTQCVLGSRMVRNQRTVLESFPSATGCGAHDTDSAPGAADDVILSVHHENQRGSMQNVDDLLSVGNDARTPEIVHYSCATFDDDLTAVCQRDDEVMRLEATCMTTVVTDGDEVETAEMRCPPLHDIPTAPPPQRDAPSPRASQSESAAARHTRAPQSSTTRLPVSVSDSATHDCESPRRHVFDEDMATRLHDGTAEGGFRRGAEADSTRTEKLGEATGSPVVSRAILPSPPIGVLSRSSRREAKGSPPNALLSDGSLREPRTPCVAWDRVSVVSAMSNLTLPSSTVQIRCTSVDGASQILPARRFAASRCVSSPVLNPCESPDLPAAVPPPSYLAPSVSPNGRPKTVRVRQWAPTTSGRLLSRAPLSTPSFQRLFNAVPPSS
eukprot:TRINITY_DN6239_c0_g2_i1.p1 TRINITY_DN6239_c0_g2~~TRINITY_DN6239_c0_g2_i1.p1  ORF type:complete len:960 (+),score=95.17 TRINITY_DN6239_c0_g2_i1:56-2935(+)